MLSQAYDHAWYGVFWNPSGVSLRINKWLFCFSSTFSDFNQSKFRLFWFVRLSLLLVSISNCFHLSSFSLPVRVSRQSGAYNDISLQLRNPINQVKTFFIIQRKYKRFRSEVLREKKNVRRYNEIRKYQNNGRVLKFGHMN